jgi:GR25 family glycosyltransferase involved in LPS biosynthesis
MRYAGRYINMDSSVERRAAMEAQFQAFGCADLYSRFPAIDGRALDRGASPLSAGELGCFLSHYRALCDCAPEQTLHLMEDDVVFGPQTAPLLRDIGEEILDHCDILFTDIFVPLNMQAIFVLMEFYRAVGMIEAQSLGAHARMPRSILYPNLKPIEFGCASSYLVGRKSRRKVVDLLAEALAEGPALPIDMAIRKMVNDGRLTASCTMPFLTSIRLDSLYDSTISGRAQDAASAVAFYLLRSYFWVGKDEDDLKRVADGLAGGLQNPSYFDVALGAFKFIFSEKFATF